MNLRSRYLAMIGGIAKRGAESKDHPALTACEPWNCQSMNAVCARRGRRCEGLTIIDHDGSAIRPLQSSSSSIISRLDRFFELRLLHWKNLCGRERSRVWWCEHWLVCRRGCHDGFRGCADGQIGSGRRAKEGYEASAGIFVRADSRKERVGWESSGRSIGG